MQIVAVPWEWYVGGTVGVGTLGEEDCAVGGGAVQVVAVPWGWYFGVTVGLVPWVEKAVPLDVMLCKSWRYRGDGIVVLL